MDNNFNNDNANNTTHKPSESSQAVIDVPYTDVKENKIIKKEPTTLKAKLRSYVNPATAILLAIVLVLSVVVGILAARPKSMAAHNAVYNPAQQLEPVSGSERIRLSNYSQGDIALYAAPGVAKATYNIDNIVTDTKGFKHYYVDDEICSYVGIDISGYNGEIDWAAVKADGVDFVMLRIGGRGYGAEGVMYEDEGFLTNLKAAREAGLDVGAYFFSQAITAEEAKEEAKYAVKLLSGNRLDYPLAFDWEMIDAEAPRTDNIDPDVLTDCARTFCDYVKKKGYTPALYTGVELAYYKYDMSRLADIDIWYAGYSDIPYLYYNYMIWQYTASGKVKGIDGDVDINICFKNYK